MNGKEVLVKIALVVVGLAVGKIAASQITTLTGVRLA